MDAPVEVWYGILGGSLAEILGLWKLRHVTHSLPCPLADGGGWGWGSGRGGLTKPCPGRGAVYPHPSPPPLRRGGDRKLTPPRTEAVRMMG